MDLKGFVDYFSPATCILSVEKKAGGGYGTIRITTGNGKYIDALALAAGGVEMDSEKKEKIHPFRSLLYFQFIISNTRTSERLIS